MHFPTNSMLHALAAIHAVRVVRPLIPFACHCNHLLFRLRSTLACTFPCLYTHAHRAPLPLSVSLPLFIPSQHLTPAIHSLDQRKLFKIEFQFSTTNLSDFIQMAAISIWLLRGKPPTCIACVCVCARVSDRILLLNSSTYHHRHRAHFVCADYYTWFRCIKPIDVWFRFLQFVCHICSSAHSKVVYGRCTVHTICIHYIHVHVRVANDEDEEEAAAPAPVAEGKKSERFLCCLYIRCAKYAHKLMVFIKYAKT